MLKFVGQVFPYGFRKNERSKATPRARFEAIAIGTRSALQERPELEFTPAEWFKVDTWIGGEEFGSITRSDGANAIAKLRGRINFVREKLESIDG